LGNFKYFRQKFSNHEGKYTGEIEFHFYQFISEIRCEFIQKDPMRFWKNLQCLGEIFAYEISKVMDYEPTEIKTPLGIANVPTLTQQPVLATILRAGLPL
jgi:uracil phosphoribosyltransferase